MAPLVRTSGKAALTAGILLLAIVRVFAEPPACSTEDVTDDVVVTFNSVQVYDLKSGEEMTVLTEIEQVGKVVASTGGKWAEIRACKALGSLLKGDDIDVWYRIQLADASVLDDYRLELCFSAFDPIHEDCKSFEAVHD